MTISATDHLVGVAKTLAMFGLFCLFGTLAMLMRWGMARNPNKPDPIGGGDDTVRKITRGMSNYEQSMAPFYKGVWITFLAVGIGLLFAAGVTYLVS